ncbi:MAG: DUF2589 domain-containing protein [Deinococcus-Thermus bacterium]|jgi:hypothetical protein|nr:DUF2589 domain-containing protein [Deinococcota bacterium]
MADRIRDLRNLPLYELIGAPLAALVQAEAQAAQTTVDFIEQVGFVRDENAEAGALGSLRMAEFSYAKTGADGTRQAFRVRVPTLSLVPIPGVRIKSATLSFKARITDAREEASSTLPTPARAGRDFLAPKMLQLRGGLVGTPAGGSSTPAGTSDKFEIDMTVEIESLPITAGLEKLLTLMDESISDEEAET